MSGKALWTGMLIWQLFCLLVIGAVAFLVIRLLVIKNFPKKPTPAAPPPNLDFYSVIIQWSADDRAFLAEVPDLPGCIADGATKAAALSASDVAISHWLATAADLNRPIPVLSQRLPPHLGRIN